MLCLLKHALDGNKPREATTAASRVVVENGIPTDVGMLCLLEHALDGNLVDTFVGKFQA